MPSRKNRKRDIVESPDGWATVKSSTSIKRPTNFSFSALMEFDSDFMNINYDNLWKRYMQIKEEVEKSKAWQDVRKYLNEKIIPIHKDGPMRLKKCVILGLGSTMSYRTQRNSLYQLALLNLIADHMGWAAELAEKCALIAQDPAFHDFDKKLLKDTLGFQVVEDPQAFDEIDEDTFLYAPHLEDVLNQKAVKKWPFWAFVNNLERYSPFGAIARNLPHSKELAMDHQLMTAYAQEHEFMKFPHLEKVNDGCSFNDCVFYWRRGQRKASAKETGHHAAPNIDDTKSTEGVLLDMGRSSPIHNTENDNASTVSSNFDETAAQFTYKEKGKGKAIPEETAEPIEPLLSYPKDSSLIDCPTFEVLKEEQMRLDEELARQLQEEETRKVSSDSCYQNICGRPDGISEQEWADRIMAMELSNEQVESKPEPGTLMKSSVRSSPDEGPSTDKTKSGRGATAYPESEIPPAHVSEKEGASDGEGNFQFSRDFSSSHTGQKSIASIHQRLFPRFNKTEAVHQRLFPRFNKTEAIHLLDGYTRVMHCGCAYNFTGISQVCDRDKDGKAFFRGTAKMIICENCVEYILTTTKPLRGDFDTFVKEFSCLASQSKENKGRSEIHKRLGSYKTQDRATQPEVFHLQPAPEVEPEEDSTMYSQCRKLTASMIKDCLHGTELSKPELVAAKIEKESIRIKSSIEHLLLKALDMAIPNWEPSQPEVEAIGRSALRVIDEGINLAKGGEWETLNEWWVTGRKIAINEKSLRKSCQGKPETVIAKRENGTGNSAEIGSCSFRHPYIEIDEEEDDGIRVEHIEKAEPETMPFKSSDIPTLRYIGQRPEEGETLPYHAPLVMEVTSDFWKCPSNLWGILQ